MAKQIPITNQIIIPFPCNADWDSMIGNDRVRVCEHCHLSVHNLSTMSFEQVEELVAQSNGRLCVRYFQLPDGRPQLAERQSVLLQLGRKSSRVAASALTVAMAVSASAATYAQGGARITKPQIEQAQKNQKGTTSKGAGKITGFAVDTAGAAIGKAEIILIGPRGQKQVAIANESGGFGFQAIDAGTYTLEVRSIGFSDFRLRDIKLGPGEEKKVRAVLQVAPLLMGVFAFAERLELERVIVKPISRPQETGVTPLMVALKENNEESIRQLLASGSDVNASTSYGTTALMCISRLTTSNAVTELLLAGADLHLTDIYDRTALMIAAETGSSDVLQKLIDAGANINYPDRDGNTPLIHAVRSHRSDNVQALIAAKADLKIKNHEGLTALKYAINQNSTEIVKMLKSAGATE